MIFCAKVVNMTTLIGAKSAHKQLILIFAEDLEGSRGARVRQDCEQLSEPRGLEGGRGRVNPPPRRLVWRFWEVRFVARWRHIHASRHKASVDFQILISLFY